MIKLTGKCKCGNKLNKIMVSTGIFECSVCKTKYIRRYVGNGKYEFIVNKGK